MKFADVFKRDRFVEILSVFPESLEKAVKDPLLKKMEEPIDPSALSKIQMLRVLVFLSGYFWIQQFFQAFLRGNLLFGLNFFPQLLIGVLLTPVLVAIGSFLSYLILLVVGFKGDFAKYTGIILYEMPLICTLGLVMTVCNSYFTSETASLLILLVQSSLGFGMLYRFLKLGKITKKRIFILLAILGALSIGSTLQVLDFRNKMAASELQSQELIKMQEALLQIQNQIQHLDSH